MNMLSSFDFGAIWRAVPYLFVEGMTFTLKLMLVAGGCGLILGFVLATMRLSGVSALDRIARAYVWLFRAVPLVLGLFWFYFLVPFIGGWITGRDRPLEVSAVAAAYVTFALYDAAYFSETIRAGIKAVSRGQLQAAYALGMPYIKVMRYIILPQALTKMLPVLLTQVIILFQDTSLVYVLSVTDFFGAAVKIAQRDNRLIEMYSLIALVYLAVSVMGTIYVQRLQSKLASGMRKSVTS